MKTQTQIGMLLLVIGFTAAFFHNAHAAPFPIATNATPEWSSSLAFDGTNYLVGIEGDELADNNITAQLIGSTGTLLGSRIKVGRTGSLPTIAFDGTNYLMVWEDSANSPNDDIYGQFISRSGTLVRTPFPISTAPGLQHTSLVNGLVFDGTNYLAVWRDQRVGPDNDNSDIYGQLITPGGTLLGSEIAISTQAGKQRHPAAAFDGTNYLTVWISQRPNSQWDTFGRFISGAGIPGSMFLISQTTGTTENSTCVAFDGNNYLVAWNRDIAPAVELGDIYCRFVSPAGSFPGNEFAVVSGTGLQTGPSLAFDGGNYLLSWSDGLGTANSEVRFQFLNSAGRAISSPFTAFTAVGSDVPLFGAILFDGRRYAIVTTLGESDADLSFTPGDVYGAFVSPLPRGTFPIANTSGNDAGFSAAFDGTNYLMGIQGGPASHDEITAQMLSSTGALVGPRVSTGRFGGFPQVAFDGANYLMVWEDVATHPNRDIYGQFISRSGTIVRTPFAIGSAGGSQTLDSLNQIVFDGSNYLVVWRDDRNGSANSDVYGQIVTPAGSLSGPAIPIATDSNMQVEPSAGFDGTNFLVAWQGRRAGAVELYDTFGKFVSRAGVPGAAFLISQNPSPRHNPISVAFDGTNYLVVWNRDTGPGFPSPSDWDIYARLVTRSGSFAGNEFPITTAPGNQPFGSAIYDGAAFLVSWIDETTGSLKNRYFSRAGAPLTAEFSLFGSQGTKFPIGGFLFDGSRLVAFASYLDSSFSNGDVYGLIVPRPRLDIPAPFANGQMPLRFTGMPGVTYAIQAATNSLSNNADWTTLTTGSAMTGTFDYTDTNAGSFSRRFYRAIQQ